MTLQASDEKPVAYSTPVLAEVSLPPVEYSEESQAVIDQMVYRFPSCASCGH